MVCFTLKYRLILWIFFLHKGGYLINVSTAAIDEKINTLSIYSDEKLYMETFFKFISKYKVSCPRLPRVDTQQTLSIIQRKSISAVEANEKVFLILTALIQDKIAWSVQV